MNCEFANRIKIVIQKVVVSGAESSVAPEVKVAKSISPTVMSVFESKRKIETMYKRDSGTLFPSHLCMAFNRF